MRLTSILGLENNESIAIIGCGGKTTLLFALASENRRLSVLAGTTTKIFRPDKSLYDFEFTTESHPAKVGITLISGGEQDGKLLSPSLEMLCRLHTSYNYTILECDGSKTLPLKGWDDYEPIIPDFTTATIGVAVCSPIGQPISEQNTHRISKFCQIADAKPGEIITAAHVAKMISSPHGMFEKAIGKKILLINQIESENLMEQANAVVKMLPRNMLLSLSRIVAGSLHQNNFEIIWENHDEHRYS